MEPPCPGARGSTAGAGLCRLLCARKAGPQDALVLGHMAPCPRPGHQGPAHRTHGHSGVVAGSAANHDEPSAPSNFLQVGLQASQEHCAAHARSQSVRALSPRGCAVCVCGGQAQRLPVPVSKLTRPLMVLKTDSGCSKISFCINALKLPAQTRANKTGQWPSSYTSTAHLFIRTEVVIQLV